MGTFDWGLSFSGLMTMCLAMVVFIIPVSLLLVYEPQKTTHPSFRGHAQSSWKLVKGKALSSILFFAFLVQFLVASATTATTHGPEPVGRSEGPATAALWAQRACL